MVILLPHSNSDLKELESAISKVPDMDEVLKFPRPGRSKVEVSIPKFKLESEIDLNENLKAMGMVDMFDENKADFSGMTGGVNKKLYVSKVCTYSQCGDFIFMNSKVTILIWENCSLEKNCINLSNSKSEGFRH